MRVIRDSVRIRASKILNQFGRLAQLVQSKDRYAQARSSGPGRFVNYFVPSPLLPGIALQVVRRGLTVALTLSELYSE